MIIIVNKIFITTTITYTYVHDNGPTTTTMNESCKSLSGLHLGKSLCGLHLGKRYVQRKRWLAKDMFRK